MNIKMEDVPRRYGIRMGDDDNIIETIKEEVSDVAKAVVAEVKSIAHEVADAIAEGKAEICGDDAQPVPPPDDVKKEQPETGKGGEAPR